MSMSYSATLNSYDPASNSMTVDVRRLEEPNETFLVEAYIDSRIFGIRDTTDHTGDAEDDYAAEVLYHFLKAHKHAVAAHRPTVIDGVFLFSINV
ncbi:hypothetical protein FHV99_004648 [Ochrobactrum sp. P20RRXII]|nr:hypothetical protein [Ochrobactrum sp. P20RRXII]NIH77396.1 hypothetical protein [Ochrobactrum sp. P20RRXII]